MEGESKKAALILMKNSHFDTVLRYLLAKNIFGQKASCHDTLLKRSFKKLHRVRSDLQNGLRTCILDCICNGAQREIVNLVGHKEIRITDAETSFPKGHNF